MCLRPELQRHVRWSRWVRGNLRMRQRLVLQWRGNLPRVRNLRSSVCRLRVLQCMQSALLSRGRGSLCRWLVAMRCISRVHRRQRLCGRLRMCWTRVLRRKALPAHLRLVQSSRKSRPPHATILAWGASRDAKYRPGPTAGIDRIGRWPISHACSNPLDAIPKLLDNAHIHHASSSRQVT